jgi:hypothetical protein
MHRITRLRPSPAMIVAIIALVLALGGTSYAAITLPAGSVGTKQLQKNAVIGSKVKNGSLTLPDINAASLSGLGRVALNYGTTSFAADGTGTVTTVTLKVPAKGFVLVNGWVDSGPANGTIGVTVWDDTTSSESHWENANTAASTEISSGQTYVFPVKPGTSTFSVRITYDTSSTGFDAFGTITAQFIPFGSTGSRTVLGPKTQAPAAAQQH